MREQIVKLIRNQKSFLKADIAAAVGATPDADSQRAFGIAFQNARRDLQEEGIFFKAPRGTRLGVAGSANYERADIGSVLDQVYEGHRAGVLKLSRAQQKAVLAHLHLAVDAQQKQRAEAASDRLQFAATQAGAAINKRKF